MGEKYSVRSAAAKLQISPSTLSWWEKSNPHLPWRTEAGGIDLEHAAEFAAAKAEEQAGQSEDHWKQEWQKWRAIAMECRARRMAGELVEVRECESIFKTLWAKHAVRLQDLPSQIASLVAHRDAAEAQAILEERVRDLVAGMECDLADAATKLREFSDDGADSDA